MPKYTKKGKGKGKAKAYTKTVSNKVKDYVQKAIKVASENKYALTVKQNNQQIYAFGDTTDPIYLVKSTIIALTEVCYMTQGTGQADRIGNEVKPVSLMWRGHMIAHPTIAKATLVRMVIFRQKDGITGIDTMADIFQDGNTVAPPGNAPIDMYRPLNRDKYKILKQKKFSILPLDQASVNAGINSIQFFKMEVSKYLPKTIKYSDLVAQPTNAGIFVCFLMCHADGSPWGTAEGPLISYSLDLTFEE